MAVKYGFKMNRATPWTIQSVDPDLREAARDAALRDGMTLNQWLQRAIADHATQTGVDPATLDHEARASVIMERLRETTDERSPRLYSVGQHLFSVDQRTEGATSRQGVPASNKVDDMLRDLAMRLEDKSSPAIGSKREQRAAPSSTPSAQERAEQQSALQDALKEALRMARRDSAPQTGKEERIAMRQPVGRAPNAEETANANATQDTPLRQQIDRISQQMSATPTCDHGHDTGMGRTAAIHDYASDAAPRATERDPSGELPALRRLNAKTDEIRDLVASVIARPGQTGKIERQLDLLGARIDELASSASTVNEAKDLARGISEIRALLSHGASPGQIEALDRKLDQLSRKVDAALGEAPAAPQFDDLARRIDNVHRRVETSASLLAKADTTALERLMVELTRKLEQPAPKIEVPAPNFAPVESELRRLSNKMDAVATRPENPVLEGLRRDVANLSSRVDAVSTTVQSATALASQTHAESLEALRKEVSGLSGRMDQIAASATEVSVLDGLQAQIELLVDRIEALPRRETASVQALEAQIVKLVGKIDTLSAPSREETMLAELQAEIARLAQQFGASPMETSAPALAMLEQVQAHLATIPKRPQLQKASGPAEAEVDQSISDLFQQIQNLREAAMDTAEVAEQLATVSSKPQESPKTPAPVMDETLKRELSELRMQQENADRRTTETLSVVHQTLEKLVGRLSDLEMDIGEVRPEPVAQPAKAPAPPVEEPLKQEKQEAPHKEPELVATNEAPKVEVRIEPKVEPKLEPLSEPEIRSARKSGPGAVLSNQASFIAAARRATHELSDEPKPKAASRLGDLLTHIGGRTSEERSEPVAQTAPEAEANRGQGPFDILRRAVSARRRSMLIALAGLVIILGSLQALRSNRDDKTPTTAMTREAPPKLALAPPPAPAAAQVIEPASPSPAPVVEIAPPLPEAAMMAPTKTDAPGFTPPLAANGFDTTPTASTPVVAPASATGGATLQLPTRLAEAANSGLASAQFEMGVRLADGRGMSQDAQAARLWLEKAANQNLAPAQYRLGAMLERGIGGAKDIKRAQELYSKAAAQGHVRAMHNMGVMNAEGADGKPDYAVAASWFRKAAEFGLRDSQYNLAILFARGMGVEKNLQVSWAWFTAATAQGDADSAQKREEIAGRLTPAQLASAKAIVEAYRARVPDPAVNEVAQPPGGWDMQSVTNSPRPAAPASAPKAKVSKL